MGGGSSRPCGCHGAAGQLCGGLRGAEPGTRPGGLQKLAGCQQRPTAPTPTTPLALTESGRRQLESSSPWPQLKRT
jgi:hypothetical protein